MKSFHSKNTSLLRFILASIACGFLFPGCGPSNPKDISGIYVRSADGVIDKIQLNTNGTFQQIITFTNGNEWNKQGTWVVDYPTVRFEGFYSAFDVDPFKHKSFHVIPPKPLSLEVLWIEKDRLSKDSEQPAWNRE